MAIDTKNLKQKQKPVVKKPSAAPTPIAPATEEVVENTFFQEDFWDSQTNGKTAGINTTLHDEAQSLQVASIIADILDEVRFEYRMSCIRKEIISPGELAPPLLFKAKTLVEWIEAYYKKYHLKNNPNCYFAGTEDPKITGIFIFHYKSRFFASSVLLGKLLSKHYEACGILLANTSGNSRQWLLNPPPATRGAEEIAVAQDPETGDED